MGTELRLQGCRGARGMEQGDDVSGAKGPGTEDEA